jgi:hypothetical protein
MTLTIEIFGVSVTLGQFYEFSGQLTVFGTGWRIKQEFQATRWAAGGNLTGVSIMVVELMPKRLELLSELVPEARVIALLVNPNGRSPG